MINVYCKWGVYSGSMPICTSGAPWRKKPEDVCQRTWTQSNMTDKCGYALKSILCLNMLNRDFVTKGGTEKPLRLAHPPFLVLARTTPTCVPRRASSETKKKYWACSNTGGATSPATMLMLTLALIGAVRPPPSWAETTIVMTEFAFPCRARDSEITPGKCTTKINVSIKLKGFWIHQAILNKRLHTDMLNKQ